MSDGSRTEEVQDKSTMAEPSRPSSALPARVKRYGIAFALVWSAAVFASLTLELTHVRGQALDSARTHARSAFEKDVLYRRWNAMRGGVYAPVTEMTPPNPYLNVPERELTTPSGQLLTKVNPAYMTRQVHELGRGEGGVQGHITSLDPIRPENAADEWETAALEAFEQGELEVSDYCEVDGEGFMRLMKPLATETSCLKCHKAQGYEVGDVRGGISVAVPVAPYVHIARTRSIFIASSHGILLLIGLAGIAIGIRNILARVMEREALVQSLEHALADVKKLSGLLPMCASCKKIRNDDGYWVQLEGYIAEHSEAEFSHGLCSECAQKLYPGLGNPRP